MQHKSENDCSIGPVFYLEVTRFEFVYLLVRLHELLGA